MTPKQRMAAAMDRTVPDRVPVMCQMSLGHMLLQTGLPPSLFWHSAGVFAEGLLRMRARYGFDGILISLHGHPADWEKALVRIEKIESGERAAWTNGDSSYYPADDLPVWSPARRRETPFFPAFDPASVPGLPAYIPVSQGLRFRLDPDHLFDIVDAVRLSAGKDYSIHGEVTSPLDYYLDLFGFEQALFGLVEDPGRAEAVLERFSEAIVHLALGFVRHGADAVKISSPYAGAGFISPAFYRRFVQPYEGRIARAVHEAGAHAYLHTCGDVHDRLELMADSGASGIECLDPPPLGRTDLAEAKKRLGGRLFIKGNVDPIHTLLRGDPDKVLLDARRRLAVGRPGGGYILSTACSIAPRTPRENVAALRAAADEAAD